MGRFRSATGVMLAALVAMPPATTPARANETTLRAFQTEIQVLDALNRQQQVRQQQQQLPGVHGKAAAQPPSAAELRRKEEVREVQGTLNALGYDAGPVDSAPGRQTRRAIEAFRRDHGLRPGSEADPDLMAALRAIPAGGTVRSPKAAAAGPAAGPDGIVRMDGRVAVAAGFNTHGEIARIAPQTGLARLVAAYALAADPTALDTDATALPVLPLLEPQLARELISAGLGRPMTDSETSLLTLAGQTDAGVSYSMFLDGLSPFEVHRIGENMRARSSEIIPSDLPPLPIPIRVFCKVSLSHYDFATEAFPPLNNSCGDRVLEMKGRAVAEDGSESLQMPADAAERLFKEVPDLDFVASYDAEVEVRLDVQGERRQVVTELRAPGRVALYRPGSTWEVVAMLGSGAKEPVPASAGVAVTGGAIDLGSEAAEARLAAFAGAAGSLPADGRKLLAAMDGPGLGTLMGQDKPVYRPRMQHEVEQSGRLLLGGYSPSEIDLIATALAVPVEYLIHVATFEKGGPIDMAVGILPAPQGDYRRPPPDDFYGSSGLSYAATAEIRGAQLLKGRDGVSILVLSLVPVSARYSEAGARAPAPVLETFDLSRVPARPWQGDVLEVPSQAGLFVRAAEAVNKDPVRLLIDSGFGPTMNEFDRRERAEAIVQAGRREPPGDSVWMEGEIRYGAYDFDSERFPAESVSLRPIDVARADDFQTPPISFRDPGAFALKLPPDEARRFAGVSNAVRIRARVAAEDALTSDREGPTVLEYDLIDADAVTTLRDPTHILRTVTLAAPEPVKLTVRDILGVGIGTPMEEAVGAVQLGIDPTAEYTVSPEQRRTAMSPDSPSNPAAAPFSTGRLLHAAQSSLAVALFTEPPAGADAVSAVVRSQVFPEGGRPAAEALRARLVEKYGAPALERGKGLIWIGATAEDGAVLTMDDPTSCLDHYAGISGAMANHLGWLLDVLESGEADPNQTVWFDPSGARWTAAEAGIAGLEQLAEPLSACRGMGEVLIATLVPDVKGAVRKMQLVLVDPERLAMLVAANRESAQPKAPDPAPGAAAAEIKL